MNLADIRMSPTIVAPRHRVDFYPPVIAATLVAALKNCTLPGSGRELVVRPLEDERYFQLGVASLKVAQQLILIPELNLLEFRHGRHYSGVFISGCNWHVPFAEATFTDYRDRMEEIAILEKRFRDQIAILNSSAHEPPWPKQMPFCAHIMEDGSESPNRFPCHQPLVELEGLGFVCPVHSANSPVQMIWVQPTDPPPLQPKD